MLKEEILKLIKLKHEGEYWDFKKQWYEEGKISDLLHDIICMANNLADRDAYIIIGIDEERDFCFVDVKNDCNRLNTQKLTDFLKDKKFAGDIRPQVHVESVECGNCTIDVIVVEKTIVTPIFLKEKYRDVNANNIYTRVQDTNTPKGKSADIDKIEYLWKKRFGLIYSPYEKMFRYLKSPGLWCDDANEIEAKKYYKLAPEYTLQIVDRDDSRNGYEYYLFNQCDSTPHWATINAFYHQTTIASFGAVFLDGGRYFTTCPRTDGISFTEFYHWDLSYKYMVLDSPEYLLNLMFYDKNNQNHVISRRAFLENILIFYSDLEHEKFRIYLTNKWKDKELYSEQIVLPRFPNLNGYNMDVFKEQYVNARILNRMLEDFREHYVDMG